VRDSRESISFRRRIVVKLPALDLVLAVSNLYGS